MDEAAGPSDRDGIPGAVNGNITDAVDQRTAQRVVVSVVDHSVCSPSSAFPHATLQVDGRPTELVSAGEETLI